MFCISLFDLFFWPLCCLFFFDLLILITPLVSSNSGSCYSIFSFFMCMFCRSLFVLFLLAIVLSVLLRFGIFKLFISNTKKKIIRTLKVKKINDIRVWVYLRVLLSLSSPKTYPSSTYWLTEEMNNWFYPSSTYWLTEEMNNWVYPSSTYWLTEEMNNWVYPSSTYWLTEEMNNWLKKISGRDEVQN
jgi:hypothetical protein